ncbi:MAG: hypothetical protein ACKVJC_03295 [Flavobacteriales bacterium]|tara:strand:- start:433 stop:972 length:540 start_codon:yes stop_codon:yes gene_type:complete
MKRSLLIIAVLFVTTTLFSQKQKLSLNNAFIVVLLDNPEDRYSLEINFTELLMSKGVKAEPSLNHIKLGADSQGLANDSITALIKSKGIDTYVLVSVRGHDKRFKKTKRKDSLEVALSQGSLYDLYRQDVISISFEFKFYRNGVFVYSDIVKCGNVSDRSTVLKRFRKKVGKRTKKWMK